ncbi:MAG: beta-ketoacyl-[acyl-carrier-protein] synthase family protein [Proteobacteria bacterium]|nr:beta-ketoacyl-[acyl-carrier-protein] synthase family protein [Pseudomonadota bacterium]MBU1708507.1 beta-ketoacyl-[acyl-carrier-protein] synthase family protein [Pseudomonadota bacterium]
MTNRVVITGMGVVSPLGNDVNRFRDALLRGDSGIDTITLFPTAALESKIGGKCTLDNYQYKDRKIDFAVYAADAAMNNADQSGIPLQDSHEQDRCGLNIGVGLELFDMLDMVRFSRNQYRIPDEDKNDPCFLQTPGDLCASVLRKRFGFRTVPQIHVSACAAATDAIGNAFLAIRRGQRTMMLAGGTDSMLNPLGLAGFCKLQALSTRNDEPARASRPFDIGRDGFVLGEGAGILVLEDFEFARARQATVYAEIVGYGNAFDAYSVSDPHPEGRGACFAMQRAFEMACLDPVQISYINAHGTSTLKNDVMETRAVRKIFGKHAGTIPISSTKSMIGHLISAAGAVEVIAGIACARVGKVHPTINLDNPDPDCDLDYVAHQSRDHEVEYLLSNSFAFGGQNATLILRIPA